MLSAFKLRRTSRFNRILRSGKQLSPPPLPPTPPACACQRRPLPPRRTARVTRNTDHYLLALCPTLVLPRREKVLEKKCDLEKRSALANKNNKSKALFHLKKKKMYEKELGNLQAQTLNIIQSIQTLEASALTTQTFMGLQGGAQALQQMHRQANAADADDVMEDIAEQYQIQEELQEAVSQPVGGEIADDDDLLAELQELDEEDAEQQLVSDPTAVPGVATPGVAAPAAPAVLPSVPATPVLDMPSAPTGGLPVPAAATAASAGAAAELAALEASMGMS